MKKIIITRGHHVFEKSAIYLARRVAACLRDAYDVAECRIPPGLTFLNMGSKEPAAQFIRNLEYANPNSLVFDFHNSSENTDTKPVGFWRFSEFEDVVIEPQYMPHYDPHLDLILNGYVIEIPAFYMPVRREVVERMPHPSLIEIQEGPLRNYSRKHGYEVDLRKTRQAGMMSEEVVEIIAEGIQDLVEQHAFSA